ncbi:MAG: hypothetical protein AAGI71_18545 [Bacteroidota bacterium]
MPNPFRPIKHLIFQKGGIGRSLSREDTVRQLNPVMKAHIILNHYHTFAMEHQPNAAIAGELTVLQKTARADTGKLAETIYSAGGVAYSGVELEPDAFTLSTHPDAMLFELLDHEEAFQTLLQAEFELDPFEHQLRTKAVLQNLVAHSEDRLRFLKEITRPRRRPTTS